MSTVIRSPSAQKRTLPAPLLRILPPRLCEELCELPYKGEIEEVRLRCARAVSLTLPDRNIILNTVITRMELDEIVDELCEGSLYAHADSIAKGFITMQDGIRVGVCGRATVENGHIIGVRMISSLCFRIPRRHEGVGLGVCPLLERGQSLLVYSRPGVGKTTLLRNVAARMARLPVRVVAVDSRGELAPFLDGERMCIDVLSGYPKREGIEIAARTMGAQLIVCDEIGGGDEARAMIEAQNNGVPFVATAHADCVRSLLRRPHIKALHDACVFDTYVGIERSAVGKDYIYTFTDREAADDTFKASGASGACGHGESAGGACADA